MTPLQGGTRDFRASGCCKHPGAVAAGEWPRRAAMVAHLGGRCAVVSHGPIVTQIRGTYARKTALCQARTAPAVFNQSPREVPAQKEILASSGLTWPDGGTEPTCDALERT